MRHKKPSTSLGGSQTLDERSVPEYPAGIPNTTIASAVGTGKPPDLGFWHFLLARALAQVAVRRGAGTTAEQIQLRISANVLSTNQLPIQAPEPQQLTMSSNLMRFAPGERLQRRFAAIRNWAAHKVLAGKVCA